MDEVIPFKGKVRENKAALVSTNTDATPEVNNVLAELQAKSGKWKSIVAVGTFGDEHNPFIMIGGVFDPHKLIGLLEDAKMAVMYSLIDSSEE